MTKKFKLLLVGTIAATMLSSWFIVYIGDLFATPYSTAWQIGLAASALLFSGLGLLTAKQWGWYKGTVGRAVIFLSLGLSLWGVGIAIWSYYLVIDPNQEIPQSYAMDLLTISVIPIWIYGIYSLSKATGAKYGLKTIRSRIFAALLIICLSLLAYVLLVTIARGGELFLPDKSLWQSFFDISIPIGDTILLTFSVLIFVYSWQYLGGRFKKSILLIIAGFIMLFLADFGFSFTDGNGTYYNGSVVDLLFMTMVSLLGLGIAHLDPRTTHPCPPPNIINTLSHFSGRYNVN